MDEEIKQEILTSLNNIKALIYKTAEVEVLDELNQVIDNIRALEAV